MNCKQARQATGLWAGGDLDALQTGTLEQHLAECPTCRERARRVRQTVVTLENDMNSPIAEDARGSLWSEIRTHVPSCRRNARIRRYNQWVGGLAVAATVLASIAISKDAIDEGAHNGTATTLVRTNLMNHSATNLGSPAGQSRPLVIADDRRFEPTPGRGGASNVIGSRTQSDERHERWLQYLYKMHVQAEQQRRILMQHLERLDRDVGQLKVQTQGLED